MSTTSIKTAINQFARNTGQNTSTDAPEIVTDMLADLMTFCREAGLNFDSALQTAQRHYAQENGPTRPRSRL